MKYKSLTLDFIYNNAIKLFMRIFKQNQILLLMTLRMNVN